MGAEPCSQSGRVGTGAELSRQEGGHCSPEQGCERTVLHLTSIPCVGRWWHHSLRTQHAVGVQQMLVPITPHGSSVEAAWQSGKSMGLELGHPEFESLLPLSNRVTHLLSGSLLEPQSAHLQRGVPCRYVEGWHEGKTGQALLKWHRVGKSVCFFHLQWAWAAIRLRARIKMPKAYVAIPLGQALF